MMSGTIIMIYVNDCSIRVVRSCITIFVQILHKKIILQREKAHYSITQKVQVDSLIVLL